MRATAAAARSAGTASTSYSSSCSPCTTSSAWQQQQQQCRRRGRRAANTARLATTARAAAAAAATAPTVAAKQDAKRQLLSWIGGTKRGADTTPLLRGQIEEAQVALETFSPEELDYQLLEGKWLLVYTTALDVTPIVGLDLPSLPGLPPPVSVGRVFQRFSSVAEGRVANIIEFSLPLLLDAQRGATFTVDAGYAVRSPRRISLTFDAAEVGQLRINEFAEALVAPALLPRGSLNHRLLLALKEFKLTFPFRSAQQVVRGAGAGASYLLTFLDEDVLIGRGPQGTFVFTRSDDDA